jgi:hypothetical protein
MSFNGIVTFEKNLRKLMDSDAFEKAKTAKRLQLAGMLMRSKYGLGSWAGFGSVKELKQPSDNGRDSQT